MKEGGERERLGVSSQHFYRLLWRKPTGNSIKSCFCFRTKMPTVPAPTRFRSFFYCPLRRKQVKKWKPPERCFRFDRKQPEGDKRVFLLTFCLYFRVARFTYFSLLPEVDKSFYLHAPCLKPIYGSKALDSDSSTDDLTCEDGSVLME